MEPAGLCGRCTGVAVPLRVVPSPTGLPSKRSMEFSRQEYRSGLPFPSPGDLPEPDPPTLSFSLPSPSPPLCLLPFSLTLTPSPFLSFKEMLLIRSPLGGDSTRSRPKAFSSLGGAREVSGLPGLPRLGGSKLRPMGRGHAQL